MCLKQVNESTGAAKKIVLAARGGAAEANRSRKGVRRRWRWQGGMTATVLLAGALVFRVVGLLQVRWSRTMPAIEGGR